MATRFIGDSNSTNRIKGVTDSVSITTGYVGEIPATATGPASNTAGSGSVTNLTSITLQPGVWRIIGAVGFNNGATPPSGFTQIYAGISTANNTLGSFLLVGPPSTGANQTTAIAAGELFVNISSATTYYLNSAIAASTTNNGVWTANGSSLRAVRIA